jgi:competence protein ComEC
MRQSLFYPTVCGFIFGTLVGPLFISGLISPKAPVFFLLVLVGSCLLWAFFTDLIFTDPIRREYSIFFIFWIGFFCMVCGIGWFIRAHQNTGDPILRNSIDKKVVLTGIVDDELSETAKTVHISVSVHSIRILLFASPGTSFNYGDEIQFTGKLEKPAPFQSDNGSTFYYDNYLAAQGIFYTVYNPKILLIAHNKGNPIKAALFSIKESFIKNLNAVIPFPESRLAAGLTVAGKQALPAAILDDFTRSGTIQVVVLSGYNVTIVAETINAFCSFLWPIVGVTFSILGIILFCVLAGGSATIVRGGIMAVTAIVGTAVGRRYSVHRALWFSAFAMLIYNPLLTAYDPSFQYSFIATIGLVYASPLVARWLQWLPEKFGLRQTASATIATQIFILPLALYTIGNVSIAGLPANLLLFLVTPPTMLLCFIAGGLVFMCQIAALPATWVAWLLLRYQLSLIHFFANLPFLFWSTPAFPLWALVLAYCWYAALLWYFRDQIFTEESEIEDL